MLITRVKRILLGEPLKSFQISEEKIPKWKALAVLSSDALSSVAYATEEILIPLAAVASAALIWSVPIALAIAVLMAIVTLSYRQTVHAYSNGGGAFVVARENLGEIAGLIAGASLLVEYVLTVSVSISAGVRAIVSAFPHWSEHQVLMATILIILLTLFNLRGIRESANIFVIPTYLFIIAFVIMIVSGIWNLVSGTTPTEMSITHSDWSMVPTFLILRAFSSGCAALTGIEAISNSVPSFREPASTNASKTLFTMALILAIFFVSITLLSRYFDIQPTEAESVVSQLARKIFGTGWMYYLIQGSTALILILAANTSYSGFPWLAAVMANHRYLPRQFAIRGDKLVFSNSIIGLGFYAWILIVIFGGDTHALVPLYALGVFIGFTLSQAGMVKYHLRNRKKGWKYSLGINFFGAVTTFIVAGVVMVSKFVDGAYIVVIVIPILVWIFYRIHNHYLQIGKELSLIGTRAPEHLSPLKHTVIVPVSGMHRGVIDALRYAISISDDVRACYVEINPEATERMKEAWNDWGHDIPLVILKSPYRSIIAPILEYIDDLEQTTNKELITVIIPEFVTAKWWHQFLHNQTALLIRTALMFRRGKVVTSVRYHLRST